MAGKKLNLDAFEAQSLDHRAQQAVKGGYKLIPTSVGSTGSFIWETVDVRLVIKEHLRHSQDVAQELP
ncbi:MAG TPA: hypothetical protein PKA00_08235 [Saprospiraceae bacterium]|nr:hypothetical protein [Saprospiraceae bacterium]HMQ82882.1 hypothetical protein [Saprospiraceae bacterium]